MYLPFPSLICHLLDKFDTFDVRKVDRSYVKLAHILSQLAKSMHVDLDAREDKRIYYSEILKLAPKYSGTAASLLNEFENQKQKSLEALKKFIASTYPTTDPGDLKKYVAFCEFLY